MADLFQEMPVSVDEMLGCARRESRLRREAYPRWIAAERITKERAAQEQRAMDAIVRHFEALKEQAK